MPDTIPFNKRVTVGVDGAPVYCVCSSASTLLTGARDGTIALASLESDRCTNRFQGHAGSIYAIQVVSTGEYFVSAGADGVIRVWSLRSAEPLFTLAGHSGPIFALAPVADGDRLVSASADRTCRVWSLMSRSEIRCYSGHEDRVRAVVVQDGWACSGDDSGTIHIWPLESVGTHSTLKAHTGSIYGLISVDDATIAACSPDRTISIVNRYNGCVEHVLQGHSAPVVNVALHRQLSMLLSIGADQTIRAWDVETWSARGTSQTNCGRWPAPLHIASTSGALVTQGDKDDSIAIWWNHEVGRTTADRVIYRERHFMCEGCGEIPPPRSVELYLNRGKTALPCMSCDYSISLLDETVDSEPPTEISDMRKMYEPTSPTQEIEVVSVTKGPREISRDYDVFLCHNSIDKPTVKSLGKQLRQRGLRPWLDEWDLPPGSPWEAKIVEQLECCRAVAVFIGSGGVGPWQSREVQRALRTCIETGYPVIPVVLANCESEPALPLGLDTLTRVDFRKRDPDPIEQLVWGITGLRPT